jgi:hypothetical protein
VCDAVIRGGWERDGGDSGNYGVILYLAGVDQCLRSIPDSDRPVLGTNPKCAARFANPSSGP